jgi:hypothetical protein
LAAAVFVMTPFAYADHDKNCSATHGTVSARTGDSITVDGKTYSLSSATVSREDGSAAAATHVKVGDKVCVFTGSADSKNATKVMLLSGKSGVASASTGSEKLSDVERKAHDEMCKGHHGTITDKTAQTITIDGTTYAMKINTPVNKQEEALLPKITKVGDRVCYDTAAAADGSKQITKLMAIDQSADRTRVREKNSDTEVEVKSSPSKVEVETPNKKIEVK